MLNFNSILIFSEKPDKLAGFYRKVIAKKPDMSDGGWSGWLVGKAFISIGPHNKVHGKNDHPERLIFNFETKDVKEQFARIKKLGAKVIKEPYQPEEMKDSWIATFADPDRNYFQLVSPWKG